jgi:hypothetical protein
VRLYKPILKRILTYGLQLWDNALTWNTEILEHFQSQILRMIVDVSWYVPHKIVWTDFQTLSAKEELRQYSSQYSARLSVHSNGLVVNLMAQTPQTPAKQSAYQVLTAIVLFVV